MSPARKYSLLNHDERERVRWLVYFKIMEPKAAINLVFYLRFKVWGDED